MKLDYFCVRGKPRREPVATTALPFTIRLDSEGVMSVRTVA